MHTPSLLRRRPRSAHALIVSGLGALALLCGALSACDPGDSQRCDDLDTALQAKGQLLSRLCQSDRDCVLVDGYAPRSSDAPAVSNATPAPDPEADEMRIRRVELCGPFEAPDQVYRAVCLSNRCEAVSVGDAPQPDAGGDSGGDGGGDGGGCDCITSADCPELEICLDSCTCSTACLDACTQVDACGQLQDFGLGVDVPNCVERCAPNVDVVGVDTLDCLAQAACPDLEACF